MQFFQTFLSSIYGPTFYKSLPKKTLKEAIVYYFLLSLLLTFLSVLSFIVPTYTRVNELTENTIPKLIQRYPKNMEIRIKNGEVSANVTQPYAVQSPSRDPQSPKNLLVIDTKNKISNDLFEKYDTLLLLGKYHVYYKDEQSREIRETDLSEIKNVTLSKASIEGFIEKISPSFAFITPLILFFVFIGMYIGYAFGTIKVLLIAFWLFLVLKGLKPALSYKDSLKVACYGVTTGLIVEILFLITSPLFHLQGFPFMLTFLTLSISIINLKSKE